jgi:hypothetical protein
MAVGLVRLDRVWLAPPPPAETQDRLPAPSVDNTCPAVPSALGKVKSIFTAMDAGALRPM